MPHELERFADGTTAMNDLVLANRVLTGTTGDIKLLAFDLLKL
ncbi:hypothetical protein [Actinoplanes sp. NPDC020271]